MSYTVHKHNADGSYSGESFEVDGEIHTLEGFLGLKEYPILRYDMRGNFLGLGFPKRYLVKTKKGPRRKRFQVVFKTTEKI